MIDLDELRASLPTVWLRTAERVVEVTGADRLAYLDATTSQSLASRAAGEAVGALVLDAHGLVLAVLEVLVLEDRVLLVVPDDEVAATVLDILGGRTFLSDARFGLTDDVVLRVHGPKTSDVVATVRADAGDMPASTVAERDGTIIARDAAGCLVLVVGVDGSQRSGADLASAGCWAGDEASLDVWRILHGVPAWGREIVRPHLPEELALLPTHVHLEKGCYPGQETVARMWMLGRPRRRLAILLQVDREVSGEVTSSVDIATAIITTTGTSPSGVEVALGFVPEGLGIGGSVSAGSDVHAVAALPAAGRVQPGWDPTRRRRRDR